MNRLVSRRVTVGIPTRNREALVVRAVRSAIAQTYPDVEIVVSDNDSDDDTLSALEQFDDGRLAIVKQSTDIGMIGNFNACLASATGEYFLMLSDDDVLATTAIANLVKPLLEGYGNIPATSLGMVWCPCTIARPDGTVLWESQPGPTLESSVSLVAGLLDGSRGPRFCSVLLRTKDAKDVGGYLTSHGPICDIGNWMRVALRYKSAVCVREPLVTYSMHQASVTSESSGIEWQRAGEQIHRDVLQLLRDQGNADGESQIRRRKDVFLTTLLVTVLLQRVGKPGWRRYALREALRSPRHIINGYVARRMLTEGWKFLRLS